MSIIGMDKARESGEKFSPEAETYEDVKRLIQSTIWKFRARYGGDVQEMLSESGLSFIKAYRGYQKSKSQFQTWLRIKVWNSLLEMRRRQSALSANFHKACQLRLNSHPDKVLNIQQGEEVPTTPSPKETISQKFQDLSDDAILAIHLAIDPDLEVILRTKEQFHFTGPHHKRKAIKRYLRAIGWGWQRIDLAFEEVKESLQ
jgi:DNA-directed RNA polymerase specialized sigma24 family protein